jgi:hypothetical protein
MDTTWAFESLRERLSTIPRPTEDSAREMLWIHDRLLGVAVSSQGAFEIFISGDRLQASLSSVRRQMQYDSWQSGTGEPFVANRIVLPEEPHYQAVAAVIVVELLRLGLGQGARIAQDVFAEVEPLVEMALRRVALSEEAIIGLIGELLCLEQLLLGVSDHSEMRSAVLDSWRGHQHAARDFSLGTNAIEVKTTTLLSSVHVAHSLAQVEATPTDQLAEHSLYLLSIGLTRAEEGGVSLPDAVERILGLVADPGWTLERNYSPLQVRFLADVGRYGASGGLGYEHSRTKDARVYRTSFTPTFVPRLYDLTDPEVRLIRREDLKGTIVQPGSVEYGFALPDRVNAENPAASWQADVRSLMRESLSLGPSPN